MSDHNNQNGNSQRGKRGRSGKSSAFRGGNTPGGSGGPSGRGGGGRGGGGGGVAGSGGHSNGGSRGPRNGGSNGGRGGPRDVRGSGGPRNGGSNRGRGGGSGDSGGSGGSRGGRGGRGGGNNRGNNRGFQSNRQTHEAKDLGELSKVITHWKKIEGDQHLSRNVKSLQDQWNRCWQHAHDLAVEDLFQLVVILARISYSENVPPPPIQYFTAVNRLFEAYKYPENERTINAVLNAVSKLYTFEWDVPKEEVIECITQVLEGANKTLTLGQKDIHDKIVHHFEELKKGWTIKEKQSQETTEDSNQEAENWRNPSIQWISEASNFASSMLPVMKVPGDKCNGVYDSVEDYFDTLLRLWVGITFSDGWEAITPHCRFREVNDKDCGNAMVPVGSAQFSCKTAKCTKNAVVACAMRNHKYALCKDCASKKQHELRGPPGDRASTDIYDGVVERITWDGHIFMKEIRSRRPPPNEIHWRTTRRLAVNRLVGLVKLPTRGSSLSYADKIYWAEVIQHNPQQYESTYRERGKLAVSFVDVGLTPVELHPEDHMAILDCQTFVPEHIPVLKALESHRKMPVPFQEGKLLNISSDKSKKRGKDTMEIAIKEKLFDSPIEDIIDWMLENSKLEPIVSICSNESLRSLLHRKLCKLVKKSTLDGGQLESFVASLTHTVHCTQGPPGTGKSYLGVVITQALMILRKMWKKANPSVGSPPILVLSYKNHAIDEFLVDLVKKESNVDLIRLGGGSQEIKLQPYLERTMMHHDREVKAIHDQLEKLFSLRQKCKMLQGDRVNIMLAKSDFSPPATENKQYEVATTLAKIIARVNLIQPPSSLEMGTITKEDMDTSDHINVKVIEKSLEASLSRPLLKKLNEGILHYGTLDPHEILWRWICGFEPLPRCLFADEGKQCGTVSESDSPYCNLHRCTAKMGQSDGRCTNSKVNGRNHCSTHACGDEDCLNVSFPRPQLYCAYHACIVCLQLEKIAGHSSGAPPRNTCSLHPLCRALGLDSKPCSELAVSGAEYCEHHNIKCNGKTGKGKPCTSQAISKEIPFCRFHKDQQETAPVAKPQESLWVGTGTCAALTKKKRPCKGKPVPKQKYCKDHLATYSNQEMASEEETPSGIPEIQSTPSPQPEPEGANVKGEIDSTQDNTIQASTDAQSLTLPHQETELKEEDTTDLSLDDEDSYMPDEDGVTDNIDEVEESDQIQHLREVYTTNEEEDENEFEWEDNATTDEEKQNEPEETENADDFQSFPVSSQWTWSMKLPERWRIIECLVEADRVLYESAMKYLAMEATRLRKEYQTAKVRASSRVYEGKEVIGGTIVGCITRLESVLSTNPFAILVEEASEVMEPLLFACLGPRTCKLEMIGDHLQLQPSMMSKFNFERINKINISLFERLIRAPSTHAVPSSVLSIQRRMRRNICDLTRLFYKDITTIIDHDDCSTKKIAANQSKRNLLEECEGGGREVPGVLPSIYFWTHRGEQRTSSVGISKQNEYEAKMVCGLAKYLVASGVPKSSIAILTPYAGQLRLLQQNLKTERILSFQSESCRLSTVDRFQGDEADVVIISMVVDKHTRSQFVQLQNRMIVLLSRARIGMYIVGNFAYFENRPAEHWKATLDLLSVPAPSDSTHDTCEVYEGKRVGSEIPLCCPVHRMSRTMAKAIEDLKHNCFVECTAKLGCSHKCGLTCHWPSNQHNTSCQQVLLSPCPTHPDKLKCSQIFKNHRSLELALADYKCPILLDVELPCGHITKSLCWKEKQYNRGESRRPQCTEPCIEPFMYPICKHTKKTECWKFYQWTENPLSAPPCDATVEFTPSCGHTITIQCEKKQQYDKGTTYRCLVKLPVTLPRCGHKTTVNCAVATLLSNWKGTAVETCGLVKAGVQYGEKEYDCSQMVTFQYPCGHTQEMKCGPAMELSTKIPKCAVEEVITNPACGHSVKVPCHQKAALLNVKRTAEPVTLIDHKNPRTDLFLEVPIHLPKCSVQVTVRRKCGHEEKLECHSAKGSILPCKKLVQLKNPLCGHAASIVCHLAEMEGWKPWQPDFLQSPSWKLFSQEGILEEMIAPPSPPPNSLQSLMNCNQAVSLKRAKCGHTITMPCRQAFQHISAAGADELEECKVKVNKELHCGHSAEFLCNDYEKYCKNPFSYICKEQVTKKCWNHAKCGKELLSVCSETALVGCDSVTEWNCDKGHIFSLSICEKGVPSACPSCCMEQVEAEMENQQLELALPNAFDGLKFACKLVPDHESQRFFDARASMLGEYNAWLERTPEWEKPMWEPKLIPCFAINTSKGEFPNSFTEKLAGQTSFGHAMELYLCTKSALKAALTKLKPSIGNITLLIGYAYTCHTLVSTPDDKSKVHPPKGKQSKKRKKKYQPKSDAFDAVATETSLILLTPYCVYPTHRLEVKFHEFSAFIDQLPSVPSPSLTLMPKRITFHLPAPQARKNNDPGNTGNFQPTGSSQALDGTIASGSQLTTSWDGYFLGFDKSQLAIEKRIQQTLSFATKVFQPQRQPELFAGIEILNNVRKETSGSHIIELLLCLEHIKVSSSSISFDEAEENLDQYVTSIKHHNENAHPLLLLALARMSFLKGDKQEGEDLIERFVGLFPDVGPMWLEKTEVKEVNQSSSENSPSIEDKWIQLKNSENCKSDAMDELLKMTGLKKVKISAIEMFKSALQFAKMKPEVRKKNIVTMNFAFLGNPGTGKTTVARLFARILNDSKIRAKSTFTACTAQKLKDDGSDEFRKAVQQTMDGVLFIDEAYDLDPKGDFKGKPIVTELLTFAEDCRDRLSIILAGYENDMNTKLFSYNEGLKSRFKEIYFEDFDEAELACIWNEMVKERGWRCNNDVTNVVSKRLGRMSGRHGFGNARDVRRTLEQATKTAMDRPDWSPDNMEILLVDVVGERPSSNPKLKALLAEFDAMIGWDDIKNQLKNILELAEKNFERESSGQAPLPFSVNKLFLGNPGTGKTTCAKMYGRLLKALNILTIGEVVSKTASDFVGDVIGASQTKTVEILKLAQGKVLLIDEAYNLNDNLFGKQVLDTLVEKVQGTPSDDIAVILIGYEHQMKEMFRNNNPGLARRFPIEFAFNFADYTDEQLLKIFNTECEKQGVRIASHKVQQRALEKLKHQKSLANFGNAGTVKLLLQNAIEKASVRKTDQIEITVEDLDSQESRNQDPFAALDKLYNVQHIRERLERLKSTFEVARREGSETPSVGHFVFQGAPGTGKTTVARVMAEILYRLELLATKQIVETSGLGLTGDYVGQTKTRAKEQMDKAKGGILFVDEAYELGKGMYGEEAMTTLLAAMTDPAYKGMVVIIAGYKEDIDQMLNRNAGLKSRFTNFIDFQDWDPVQCASFFKKEAESRQLQMEDQCHSILCDGFAQLQKLPGWANGRDVKEVWKEAFEYRASRISKLEGLSDKPMTAHDVSKAIEDMISKRPLPKTQPLSNISLRPQYQTHSGHNNPPPTRSIMSTKTAKQEETDGEDKDKKKQDGRDDGVPDEIWQELEMAKKKYEEDMERERLHLKALKEEERKQQELYEIALKQEEERKKKEMQEKALLEEAKRKEQEMERARIEAERKRQLEEQRAKLEEIRKQRELRELQLLEQQRRQQEIQEKLRRIVPCPAGFQWLQVTGGWRCGGGSHFVSNETLHAQFTR